MRWLRSRFSGTAAARRATGVAVLALAQVALGITTLVLVVPFAAALAHQLLAMALLAMVVVHARLSHATAPLVRPVQAGTGTLASALPG